MGRSICSHCHEPQVRCVCSCFPEVQLPIPLIIFQHPHEAKHPFNSAKWVKLVFPDACVVSAVGGEGRKMVLPNCLPSGSYLLYPSEEDGVASSRSEGAAPKALVVLDGTWQTVRKLLRDNPWLGDLPRLSLKDHRGGKYRIREAPNPAVQLSTFEAVAYALAAIDSSTAIDSLLKGFDLAIERQLQLKFKIIK